MIPDYVYTFAEYSCYVIAGAVVALNAIAPLTKNETDNKLLNALSWVSDKIQLFVLPFLKNKRKQP
jgi:hypothetical protein